MPRAIRLHQTGGPEVLQWEEAEVGDPGGGRPRVRHTAVGVNFVDTYQRSGLYPLPLPGGLGSEGAGVVEAVGPGVTHVKPGDRVAYAGGPRLVHQVLFYPVTDASFETESYQEFATGYFLRRDAMQWFWDQYTQDPAQRAEVTASPLRASAGQLAGLPPALVITAEADVLRDEGEAYANRLRDAGVPVTAARFQGIIHDFVMLHALAHTRAAEGAMLLATQTLRRALHGKG